MPSSESFKFADMHHQDTVFMQRCFDLARLGAGQVSPNPMVGAVLVYDNRIIGEGFHRRYGEAHAEVHAVQSVAEADRHLISKATLYVSLEPCCIFGRTPPCTDLILAQRIPKVVISCLDQTPGVAGQGVERLRSQGVEVVVGLLEESGRQLSRFRNHYVTQERPYVILKFAQTKNGFFGLPGQQFWITHDWSQRLVHKWRSEVDAILVGANTARIDNPQLTNRRYFGKSPLRIVVDRTRTLLPNLHLFDGAHPTLLVSDAKAPQGTTAINVPMIALDFQEQWLAALLQYLHQSRITTLLVEGGAQLLQHFLDQQLWDEARVLEGGATLSQGILAPRIPGVLIAEHALGKDSVRCYRNV